MTDYVSGTAVNENDPGFQNAWLPANFEADMSVEEKRLCHAITAELDSVNHLEAKVIGWSGFGLICGAIGFSLLTIHPDTRGIGTYIERLGSTVWLSPLVSVTLALIVFGFLGGVVGFYLCHRSTRTELALHWRKLLDYANAFDTAQMLRRIEEKTGSPDYRALARRAFMQVEEEYIAERSKA